MNKKQAITVRLSSEKNELFKRAISNSGYSANQVFIKLVDLIIDGTIEVGNLGISLESQIPDEQLINLRQELKALSDRVSALERYQFDSTMTSSEKVSDSIVKQDDGMTPQTIVDAEIQFNDVINDVNMESDESSQLVLDEGTSTEQSETISQVTDTDLAAAQVEVKNIKVSEEKLPSEDALTDAISKVNDQSDLNQVKALEKPSKQLDEIINAIPTKYRANLQQIKPNQEYTGRQISTLLVPDKTETTFNTAKRGKYKKFEWLLPLFREQNNKWILRLDIAAKLD